MGWKAKVGGLCGLPKTLAWGWTDSLRQLFVRELDSCSDDGEKIRANHCGPHDVSLSFPAPLTSVSAEAVNESPDQFDYIIPYVGLVLVGFEQHHDGQSVARSEYLVYL